tara:strand:- start:1460 stop:2173 length:714 start_codon:yes stop_codon:yes gene_type:complete
MIEAYIICWNEIDTIQLTIDHYKKFCERITFYDNHSNDGTAELIRLNDCNIEFFGTKGKLEDREYIKIKNNCWKDSKADWVIVCDCDEIIWHKNLKEILSYEKATVFKTIGFDIFSEEMPKDDFLEIQTGVPSLNYSKIAVFSPTIKSINYVYGCHVADPVGGVRFSSERLNLFHYRNIGGLERLKNRHKQYRERLSDHNKKLGLGIHYLEDDDERQKNWYNSLSKAVHFNTYRNLE